MSKSLTLLLAVATAGTALAQGPPDITKYVGGHKSFILGIAYSSDGTRIATTQSNGPINIFRADTGELTRVLPITGRQIAFTPDSERIVVGTANDFRVFDADTGVQLQQVTIPVPYVTNIRAGAVSADGMSATALISDQTAIVWNLNSGESKHTFATPGIIATSAAFTAAGEVAVGTNGGQIVVYDPTNGSIVRTTNAHNGFVNSLEVVGSTMVSAGGDARVKTWNAANGNLIRQFQGHNGAVNVARLSPDGQFIASGGMNGQFYLWNAATGGLICIFSNHQGFVRATAFSPTAEYVVAGDDAMNVNHWRINGILLVRDLSNHKGDIDEVAVSDDGKTVVSASYDGTAKTWRNGQLHRTINFGPDVYTADVSPDNRYVALGGSIITRVYDIETGAQIGQTFHGGVSKNAEFARDSQSVFSTCTGHEIKRITLNGTQMWLTHLTGPVVYVDVPPQGDTVAAATLHSNQTQVWTDIHIVNANTGTVLRTWTAHADYIRGLEFAPNGDLIAAFADGQVRSWNPATGALKWMHLTPSGVQSIALNRLGDVILTGGYHTVRFIKTSNGALLKTYDDQLSQSVSSIAFLPDESEFVYGLDSGTFAIARNPFSSLVEGSTLLTGQTVSGSHTSLQQRDQAYWRLNPGLVLSTAQAPLRLELTTTVATPTASRLTFDLTAGATTSALEQRVELYDYQAGAWEVVDVRPMSNQDQRVTIDELNASRFVHPLSRETRARLSWKQTGPALNYPWQVRLDQAFWVAVP